MSKLEQEVTTLRGKVKQLEEEIVERTRNYMLQIENLKKANHSAAKGKSQEHDDEPTNHNLESVSKLRNEVKQLQKESADLSTQMKERNETIQSMRAQMSKLRNKEIQLTVQLQNTSQDLESLRNNIQNEATRGTALMNKLEEKINADANTIRKLEQEILRTRSSTTFIESQAEIERLRKDNMAQEGRIRQLMALRSSNSQDTGNLQNAWTFNTSGKDLNSSSLLQQIQQLKSSCHATQEQKKKIEYMLENSLSETRSFKQKYHNEIANSNNYLQQLSSLKSHVASLERQKQKLHQELLNPSVQLISLKETKQAEVNTQPPKPRDTLKKSQQGIQASQQQHSSQDAELVKLNDKLNQQILRKEEEYKRLLEKIDEVESQNNKLIGTVESLKRDIGIERESQKILQGNIRQQVNVIESQKNTIAKMEQQYETHIKDYQVQIQELNEKLLAADVINETISQETPEMSKSASHKSGDSIKKERSESEGEVSKERQAGDDEVLDSQVRTPNVSAQSQNQVHYNEVELNHSAGLQRDQRKGELNNSPKRFQAPKMKIKKLQFSKLEKKFSVCTYENKAELHKHSEDIGTKTQSARGGMKSSRVLTPHDLKTNIKSTLDNTVLLGKGVQSIEVISSLVKQIQSFTGYPYQDIMVDLEKKKEIQKSAFNNTLMKEIAEISKVRQQYQERIQQSKEEDKHLIKEKEEVINQLRVQLVKQQSSHDQMIERIHHLELDLEKSKKVESQKEIITKSFASKNSDNQHIIQKLRQQKAFLTQRIEKYQESIREYDTLKRKMFSENQKQKSELHYLKAEFKRVQEWAHEIESIKNFTSNRIREESEQFIDIIVSRSFEVERKNKQLLIQLRDKQESLEAMVEEVDFLKQNLKLREDALKEVGRQVHEIRADHLRMSLQENGESLTLLKKQQTHLRAQLKLKQQTLLITQKELSRHRNQIVQLQKQLEQEKQKSRGYVKSKRQMMDEITNQRAFIQSLQKRLAIVNEEESYYYEKSCNQFEEVMEKLFHVRKRERENKIKNKVNSNFFKSINSSRFDHEGISTQRMVREYKEMKEVFKTVAQSIYETYGSLPLTSETTTLFEAENNEELLNQLKDIRKFAEDYVALKQQVDSQLPKMQQAYVGLLKGLIRSIETVNDKVLYKIVEELKVGPKEQQRLREKIPAMMSVRELASPTRKEKKKPSIELEV